MSGETEEMSAFSGIEYDPNVIWSDDPENAYFRQMVGDRDGNNTDSLIGDSTLADLEDGQTLPTYDRPIVQLQGSTGLSLGEDTIDNITPASAAVKNRSFGWFTARGNGQGHEKSSPGSLTKGKSPVSALSSKFGGEIAETNPPDHSFVDVNLDLENVNVPNTIFLGERPSADTTSGTTKRSKSKKDSDQATPSQTTKRCIRLIILFLTLSVVASITVLVLTLTNTSSKDKGSALSNDELPNDDPDFEFPNTLTEGPTPTNPAPSPIAISTSAPAPTPAPTVPSTLAPAVNPTPAPVPTLPFNPLPTVLTGGTTSPVLVPGPSSKDILMEDVSNQIVQLSPRSLDALQTAGSPQYRALEWVVNEQIASSLQNNRALVANSTATNNDVVDSKILQRWILSTFYYSTEGDQWDESGDWLNATDECSWTNVDCTSGNGDDDHDRVEKLYLSGNNLAGELPLELSLLSSSLVYLPLNSNDIGGTIPTEFGLLTKLERLQLTSNNVGGEIPSELGQLSNLSFLSFGRCENIIGALPTELGRLGELRILDLSRNQIIGTIPTELGDMTSLESISLGRNLFFGKIPSQFGQLSALERLSFNSNYLTGEVPLEVCQLPQTIAVKADCLEVVCSCCSECCIDGGGCSDVTSAPTPSPTSSPVMQLTASPTASPTTALPTANTLSSAPTTKAPTLEPSSGPTRPPIPATTPSPTPSPFIQTTAWPTTSPVTSLPTASPTPRPSGCTTAGISRDKDCYSTGDDIIASFTNCNPAPDDWIGVYPASADPNNLGDPNNSLWVWLCGSKSSCDSSVDAGTVTFENAGEVGKFKIYLVRRISGGPYSAYAESESFEVGNSCAAP